MNEENTGCPVCHYVWYRYYEETEIPQSVTGVVIGEEDPIYEVNEMPVAVKTPRGHLCRLCRHEWKEDGTPVSQETIDQSVAGFKKQGAESHAKIHGLQGKAKK